MFSFKYFNIKIRHSGVSKTVAVPSVVTELDGGLVINGRLALETQYYLRKNNKYRYIPGNRTCAPKKYWQYIFFKFIISFFISIIFF